MVKGKTKTEIITEILALDPNLKKRIGRLYSYYTRKELLKILKQLKGEKTMIKNVQELKAFLGDAYTISYRSHIAINARVNRINIDFPISKEDLMKKLEEANYGKN